MQPLCNLFLLEFSLYVKEDEKNFLYLLDLQFKNVPS